MSNAHKIVSKAIIGGIITSRRNMVTSLSELSSHLSIFLISMMPATGKKRPIITNKTAVSIVNIVITQFANSLRQNNCFAMCNTTSQVALNKVIESLRSQSQWINFEKCMRCTFSIGNIHQLGKQENNPTRANRLHNCFPMENSNLQAHHHRWYTQQQLYLLMKH